MTQVRVPEFASILARPPRPLAPSVERGLRAAASTLCHAAPDLITSTTFVVNIGPDDLDALEHMVHEIVDAHALEAAIHPHVGWCAVRFSRRTRTAP
jgi:hypothetical protein